ncbi:acyl-CoA carboxylase epsilon subunit [Actinomadura sp. SCN-SB]|uniref:acyl-CoA carboxylase epsilon subunit n=1 Tax=Actinomadura sp. SCN-SB TaxID=3373092 RepID=UPI0037509FEF
MSTSDKPLLQVVRGDATPEEIAAVVAVLAARARAARARDGAGPRPVSRWADRERLVRSSVSEVVRPRGDGAWRAGAFPR